MYVTRDYEGLYLWRGKNPEWSENFGWMMGRDNEYQELNNDDFSALDVPMDSIRELVPVMITGEETK